MGGSLFWRGSLWGSLFLEGVIVSGGGHCGGLCFRSRSLWWSLCLETIFLKVPEVFRLHTARSPDLCSLRMPLTSLAPVQRVQCARVQKITPAPNVSAHVFLDRNAGSASTWPPWGVGRGPRTSWFARRKAQPAGRVSPL